MAKDILAFLGLIFLTVLIIAGVGVMALFYDRVGIFNLPESMNPLTRAFSPSSTISVVDIGVSKPEWSNPLADLPVATRTPLPTLTPTPVPPLSPEVYETETILAMKRFVSALERWLALNNELTEDNHLLIDDRWQAEMKSALEDIRDSSRDLASVGPAPAEYARIDQWLDRVDREAQGLHDSYLRAIAAQGDMDASRKHFTTASDHFVRIKEYLLQAVDAMVAAGWSF